ncbi:hypothetical protein [Marinobacter fonticola]|uniref:hypothetical protein n=1 Tax=Marinobacter fonticola TaxID=2603215 RepID=UPI0011E64CA6|nr:hypothetical protein [Marinobacter fonticola]
MTTPLHPTDEPPLRFDGGGFYRIVVQGGIPEDWMDRLNGMDVVTSDDAPQYKTYVLQGRVRDQTELNGLLETLYRLQVVIISVDQQKT